MCSQILMHLKVVHGNSYAIYVSKMHSLVLKTHKIRKKPIIHSLLNILEREKKTMDKTQVSVTICYSRSIYFEAVQVFIVLFIVTLEICLSVVRALLSAKLG